MNPQLLSLLLFAAPAALDLFKARRKKSSKAKRKSSKKSRRRNR